jgi:murein DD-endopeptidase MepM/ murein hydrolase activator NlpD
MEDDPPLVKKWFLYAIGAVLGIVVFSNNAHAAVSEDEIAGFLYKINDAVQQRVATLSGNAVYELPVPVLLGVSPGDFSDTWGEPRASGRAHTGTDIIALKGAFIVSPTEAVVTKIGYGDRGGNFVITANPGGEQYYYAHLDSPACGSHRQCARKNAASSFWHLL